MLLHVPWDGVSKLVSSNGRLTAHVTYSATLSSVDEFAVTACMSFFACNAHRLSFLGCLNSVGGFRVTPLSHHSSLLAYDSLLVSGFAL